MKFSDKLEKKQNEIAYHQEIIDRLKNELKDYYEKIIKYSKFNPVILYNGIIKVMNALEKEQYRFEEFNISGIYVATILNNSVDIPHNSMKLTDLLILMENRLAYFLTNYEKPELDSDGNLYVYKMENDDLETNIIIEDEKFPYIEEFINFLISYRIEHELDELDEIDELADKFVSEKQEEYAKYSMKK